MVSAGSGIPFRTLIMRLCCKKLTKMCPLEGSVLGYWIVPKSRFYVRGMAGILGDVGRSSLVSSFQDFCFNAYQKASNFQNIKSRNSKILGENRRIVPGMSIYTSIYAHPKEKFLKISKKRIYAHPYIICSSVSTYS